MEEIVLVIRERDLKDKEETVIGVATTREHALKMITKYYGEVVISDFRDTNEHNHNLEFSCLITVSGFLGGVYKVWAEYFNINYI